MIVKASQMHAKSGLLKADAGRFGRASGQDGSFDGKENFSGVNADFWLKTSVWGVEDLIFADE